MARDERGVTPQSEDFSAWYNEVVFKAFGRSDVPYRVCVRRPGGRAVCKDGVTGGPGEPSVKNFISAAVGAYRVVWKVAGQVVDRSGWFNEAEGV